MEKLIHYLKTTTRREKTLLIVFFCALVVFAYEEFAVKPLEEDIFAKKSQIKEEKVQIKRKYTEDEIEEILKQIQTSPFLGTYEEVGRSFLGKGDLNLQVDLSLGTDRERLEDLLAFLDQNYQVSEKKISIQDSQAKVELKVLFPLKFKQISQDQGPIVEAPLVKKEITTEPVKEGQTPQTPEIKTPGGTSLVVSQEKKIDPPSKAPGPKNSGNQPVQRAQALVEKTPVNTQINKKIDQAKEIVSHEPKDLPAIFLVDQGLEKLYHPVDLSQGELEGDRFLNPIVRQEEDYTFSYLNSQEKFGLISLSFPMVPLKEIEITTQLSEMPPCSVLYREEGENKRCLLEEKTKWRGKWIYGLEWQISPDKFLDILTVKAYQ